jgi:hypothetical protein
MIIVKQKKQHFLKLLNRGESGLLYYVIPGFKGRNGKLFNAHLIWNKKSKKFVVRFLIHFKAQKQRN